MRLESFNLKVENMLFYSLTSRCLGHMREQLPLEHLPYDIVVIDCYSKPFLERGKPSGLSRHTINGAVYASGP